MLLSTFCTNLPSNGMVPGFQQIKMIWNDFIFREKQSKDFGSEDFFRKFELDSQGYLK